VQRFRLAELPGRAVGQFGSRFDIAPLLRIAGGAHVALARLPPAGLIGRHPAVSGQLLIVVEGSGWVSGEGGERQPIAPGDGVFWSAGEEHETGSDGGLTAILIEGPDVAAPR
jgi:quercetin dioxygenase-like cupin family protein